METIEESVFARKRWVPEKMRAFGFRPVGDGYVLERSFLDGDFKAILSVTEKGAVTGRVIDAISQDDYYQLRQKNATGAYVNTVRAGYEQLLEDVAAACCQDVLFASDQANRLTQCILERFQVEPDFPWEKEARYQAYGVFRHASNRKWFALIMRVKCAVLDKDGNPALVDVINLKIPPEHGEALLQLPGVYPAYHMNHKTWISVVLDDTQTDEAIMAWIEGSYPQNECRSVMKMNNTWDADSYRDNFSFVPKYGEDVLKLLTVGPGSKVVDLGCGNGSLTDRLQSLGYQVMGIDASPAMLEIARKEYPNISFQQADALSFQLDTPADAIFSNAVFHWIDADKQETLLRNVSRNLRPGGELVCEFGGYGCGEAVHSTLGELFREHKRTYKKIVFFPTIGQYAPLIEKCGMRVEYAILFDRPTPQKGTIKDWIRMFDLKPFDGIPEEETDEIINEAEERLRSRLFIDGTWYVDYVRIRLRARKL